MPSALVSSSLGPGAPALADDLALVGVAVLGQTDCPNLLQDVIKESPDFVVIYDAVPDAAVFQGIAALNAAAPRPVILFTDDPDAEKIALATRSGVNAYVVNGYSRSRLRSVLHLAQARFQHDQTIRGELAEVNQRFAERKLVDRAKGILMGARQLREEEAYRALRSAAMHNKQRIGQVAQVVIDSARYGEAVNRAGQLRMLSQRLVKLYALNCIGTSVDRRGHGTAGLFADSMAQVEANLAILGRILSRPTFGDLLEAVLAPWSRLRSALGTPAVARRLPEVDGLAEELLVQAEQLTENLEVGGFATALHVINVAGRQRMLCQRLAKEALIAGLLPAAACPPKSAAETELLEGLVYLQTLPLSNTEIARELGGAVTAWEALLPALAQPGTAAGREGIARWSEVLLAHFDRLTDQLERGMQALVR